MNDAPAISYRPLVERDIAFVPLQCQGEPAEVRGRIRECGSSAMLALDGERCAGQLQFRPYVEGTHSPRGIHHPLYWMDFPVDAPALPERTLSLFCYHVGQLEGDPDNRDPRYLGRGIGQELLHHTVRWAAEYGFDAIVAKGLAPSWPVLQYMGGMPWPVYQQHGFSTQLTYHDADLRQVIDEMLVGAYGSRRLIELRDAVDGGADLDALSEVQVCVLSLAQA